MEREAVVRHPLFFCIRIAQDPGARLETTHKGDTHSKKSLRIISSSFCVLPWKDSNSHRRNQNPTCYHYTTRQFLCLCLSNLLLKKDLFVFDTAKVDTFFLLCKCFCNFFSKKLEFPIYSPISTGKIEKRQQDYKPGYVVAGLLVKRYADRLPRRSQSFI